MHCLQALIVHYYMYICKDRVVIVAHTRLLICSPSTTLYMFTFAAMLHVGFDLWTIVLSVGMQVVSPQIGSITMGISNIIPLLHHFLVLLQVWFTL